MRHGDEIYRMFVETLMNEGTNAEVLKQMYSHVPEYIKVNISCLFFHNRHQLPRKLQYKDADTIVHDSENQYAGYIVVDTEHYYYWFE